MKFVPLTQATIRLGRGNVKAWGIQTIRLGRGNNKGWEMPSSYMGQHMQSIKGIAVVHLTQEHISFMFLYLLKQSAMLANRNRGVILFTSAVEKSSYDTYDSPSP